MCVCVGVFVFARAPLSPPSTARRRKRTCGPASDSTGLLPLGTYRPSLFFSSGTYVCVFGGVRGRLSAGRAQRGCSKHNTPLQTQTNLVEPAQGGGARAVQEGVDILLLAPVCLQGLDGGSCEQRDGGRTLRAPIALSPHSLQPHCTPDRLTSASSPPVSRRCQRPQSAAELRERAEFWVGRGGCDAGGAMARC